MCYMHTEIRRDAFEGAISRNGEARVHSIKLLVRDMPYFYELLVNSL